MAKRSSKSQSIPQAPEPIVSASSPLASDAIDVIEEVTQGPVDPISPADTVQLAQNWMNVGGKTATAGGEKDSAGEVWSPTLHSATKAKTADGRWRRRRGAGAGPRSSHTLPHDMGTPTSGDLRTDGGLGPEGPDYRALAHATVATLTGSLVMLGGSGWAATSPELQGMNDAWEAYYRTRGIRNVPPEVMLAATMGTYVMLRVTDPANTVAFRSIYERVMQRSIPNARAYPGSNGTGEVHANSSPIAPVPITPGSDRTLYDRPERI